MKTYWIINMLNSTATAPAWVWVVAGIALVGFIGYIAWVVKETWVG